MSFGALALIEHLCAGSLHLVLHQRTDSATTPRCRDVTYNRLQGEIPQLYLFFLRQLGLYGNQYVGKRKTCEVIPCAASVCSPAHQRNTPTGPVPVTLTLPFITNILNVANPPITGASPAAVRRNPPLLTCWAFAVCTAGSYATGAIITAEFVGSLTFPAPACVPCAQGYVAPSLGATTCFPCSANTYALGDGVNCAACPVNAVSPAGSAGAADCSCQLGYALQAGAPGCRLCPAGAVYDISTGACAGCPAGSYSSVAGAPACSVTPPGYANVDASTILPCAPGTYQSGLLCAPCAAGTASPVPGAVACLPCAPGWTSSPGATQCAACPAGAYFDLARGACAACPAGSSSAAGSVSCAQTPAGLRSAYVVSSSLSLAGVGTAGWGGEQSADVAAALAAALGVNASSVVVTAVGTASRRRVLSSGAGAATPAQFTVTASNGAGAVAAALQVRSTRGRCSLLRRTLTRLPRLFSGFPSGAVAERQPLRRAERRLPRPAADGRRRGPASHGGVAHACLRRRRLPEQQLAGAPVPPSRPARGFAD